MAPRLALLFLVACVCGAAAVTVSRARGDDGGAARMPAIPVAAPEGERCPIPTEYRPLFVQAARETRLPLALLVAVARVEPRHAAGRREDVSAGARYLRRLFDRFPSSELALAAYDAGPHAVEQAGGPPTGETLTYVADVTSVWRSLRGCT